MVMRTVGKRTVRTIGLTASAGLLLSASWSFAHATSGAGVEPQETQTAVISAQVSSRSASAPLDMRVSVQHVYSKPADILQVLAKAAGLTVDVSSSDLRPVTLTLTNVRLRTALDAICDTAACAWKLDGNDDRSDVERNAGRERTATSGLPRARRGRRARRLPRDWRRRRGRSRHRRPRRAAACDREVHERAHQRRPRLSVQERRLHVGIRQRIASAPRPVPGALTGLQAISPRASLRRRHGC